MKYSAVILALVAGAFAVPQASITSAPSAPLPSGLTPAVSCALNCTAGDVMCQAACLGNARPNASQVVDTNKCAAACDQGSGSTSDSEKYSQCVQSCINSLFPSSQTALAPGGGQVASGSAGASPTTGSARPSASAGSSGAQASVSGSGAAPQSTGAADVNSARLAGAGLAGLLAIFVL